MRLLVSACLLGVCCRYDGQSKQNEAVLRALAAHEIVPVCPEQLGGLPTPRPPAERKGERVINREGADVTAAYQKGAEETLRLCRLLRCDGAILKARSPSCGKEWVYDGGFTGMLTDGNGVTAELLLSQGIPVWTEEEMDSLAACPSDLNLASQD